MFSVLLVSNPSTKVVENPFQVQMPAIEELQGLAAGLSEVVIGLVNTNNNVPCCKLTLQLQQPTRTQPILLLVLTINTCPPYNCRPYSYQPFANIQPRKMILPNFRSVSKSKHFTLPPKFACRSWNNRLLVSGRIQCYLSAMARKGFVIKPPRSN